MRATANGVLLAGLAAATAPASAQEAMQASQTTPATDAAQTAPLEPARGNIPRTIRCESPKGRERSCQAETRGGVRVSRQLSRSPCVEGQTWGVRPGEIWVKAGCRADFGLGGIDTVVPGPLYFKCESTGLGRQHCPVSTRGGVRLVRQLSKSDCIQHSTWGFDRNSVWVSQGCRAEFQAGEGLAEEEPDVGPHAVRCESDRGRERRCDVGVWNGAELTKQLSKSPCIQNHSWGWDQRGVWVSRGCRAEFRVW